MMELVNYDFMALGTTFGYTTLMRPIGHSSCL